MESYGAVLYSYGKYALSFTAGKHYSWMGEFEFDPINFAPYIQTVFWTREDINPATPFAVYAMADRVMAVGDYALTITENMATGDTSLYQALFNNGPTHFTHSQMADDEEYEHEYEEPYLTGNLLTKFNKVLNPTLAHGNYYTKKLFWAVALIKPW